MGLFDIFKQKSDQPKQDNDDNESSLETTLRKAATEPAHRADLYKKLLSEDLLVLTYKTQIAEGSHVLEENTKVNIRALQDGIIPVFTSKSKIFDKGVIKEEVTFLQMRGDALFNMAKGATFVLNPYSDYGKELLPHEIESMLNGTILTDGHKQITVQQDTQVQLGQPSNYPTEIVNALKILFAEKPNVKAAYLAWIFNPSANELPHLIFGLDVEGDSQAVTNEAGFTAQQLSKPDTLIDFIQIDEKSGISSYFLDQTKPFYAR